MPKHPSSHSRTAGQSIIRSTTGVVAAVAIVGTGSMAFFVSHAYAGKSAGTSSSQYAPSATAPSDGGSISQQQYQQEQEQYQQQLQQEEQQQQYGDPYAQQGGQGGYAPQPGAGGQPQASTGGS